MRLCKLLIIFLFLFTVIGKLEAYEQTSSFPNAFRFPPNLKICAGRSFSTSMLDLSPSVSGLTIDGWYRPDGTRITQDLVTVFFVPVDGLEVVLHSRVGGTEYRDPLNVEAVLPPRIWLSSPGITVCTGSDVLLKVDSTLSADRVFWEDNNMRRHPDGTWIRATQFTTFTITASNNFCDEIATMSYYVAVTPVIDTNTMVIVTEAVSIEICPGCTRNLNDFVEFGGADEITVESLQWFRSGGGAVPNPTAIGAPAEGATDIYEGRVTALLTRTNECGTASRRVTATIMVRVTRSTCLLQSHWVGNNRSKILEDRPCRNHFFDIINPQIDGFEFTVSDIEVSSLKGYPIVFQREFNDGPVNIFRYMFTPQDEDEISIKVTYRNKCSDGETLVYTDLLHFVIDPRARPQVMQQYCRADTLNLVFFVTPEHMFLELPVQALGLPDLNSAHSDFREISRSGGATTINRVQYAYKDTVHRWSSNENYHIKNT